MEDGSRWKQDTCIRVTGAKRKTFPAPVFSGRRQQREETRLRDLTDTIDLSSVLVVLRFSFPHSP